MVSFAMFPGVLHATLVSKVSNPMSASGSFVADEGRVLGPEYERLLNEISSAVRADGGAEIAVVTVDNLAGLTVEEYAVKLFERFKIGSKEKDDGILILMSRDDRKARIEVGYGLEGVFNDALVGRLIDENAIPNFKEGQFGKGLYLLARAVAEKEAASRNKKFSLPMPAELPAQPALPGPQKSEVGELAKPENLNNILAIYFIVMLSLTLASIVLVSIKVYSKKTRAAKGEVINSPIVLPFLQWIFGGVVIVIIAGMQKKFFLPILVYVFSSIGVTALTMYSRYFMEKRLSKYRLACRACGRSMRLVTEDEDDKLLSQEEVAEERAGGMDYEFWVCDSCKKAERFDVRMSGANKCPKCKRLSVKRESQVLEKATEHHHGKRKVTRTCFNTACGFHDEKEERIPKKSTSDSDHSGNGGGGGGGGDSFGGGSSGGGGASRGW